MEQRKHFRFFCPRRKVDDAAQTLFIFDGRKKIQYSDYLHEETIKNLIFQEMKPSTPLERSIAQDFSSSVGFFSSTFNDQNFDLLSPPESIYQNLIIGFTIEFCDQYFIITRGEQGESRNFPYHKNLLPLIECFENKEINKELFAILDKLKVENWDHGKILCQIIDYHFEPAYMSKVVMTISDELIPFIINNLDKSLIKDENYYESERRLIMLSSPVVCVDPSPDVARLYAMADWRKKMWVRNSPKTEEDITPRIIPKIEKETPSTIKLSPLTAKIEVPIAITQMLAETSRKLSIV